MEYTNHSGGCPGADMTWENEGNKYGVKTIAYSFFGHIHEGKNPVILLGNQLYEGFDHIKEADKKLQRDLDAVKSSYMKSLLARNWFQIKNCEKIYAIGTFVKESRSQIDGGTGWAIQMAIDNKKPVYFYDQDLKEWNVYDYIITHEFVVFKQIPKLVENFAGIGTRNINQDGIEAIKKIYELQFGKYV